MIKAMKLLSRTDRQLPAYYCPYRTAKRYRRDLFESKNMLQGLPCDYVALRAVVPSQRRFANTANISGQDL